MDLIHEEKDEVFSKFKEFKAFIENHTDKKIKTFQSNNGEEFTSKRECWALKKVEKILPIDPQVKPQVPGAQQGRRERCETPNDFHSS